MADLRIALKGVYFDQIKAGEKSFEFRLVNPYWRKRLVDRSYDRLILTKGYPKSGDEERTLTLPYRGYELQTITHEEFGPEPVQVFALIIERPPLVDQDYDGLEVRAGDTIGFSYGIPPKGVRGVLIEKGGKLVLPTPDENPKEATLDVLREHVGGFWKVNVTEEDWLRLKHKGDEHE